jgi:predicted amidohydrolase YtcJ
MIQMGIPVTVQHPLLYSLAPLIIQNWGVERTKRVFPLREWIEGGALLGACSDYPVGSYEATTSIWGMVTRQTKVGVMGPESAIDLFTAVRLYTADAARLIGEDDRSPNAHGSWRRGIARAGRDLELTRDRWNGR